MARETVEALSPAASDFVRNCGWKGDGESDEYDFLDSWPGLSHVAVEHDCPAG